MPMQVSTSFNLCYVKITTFQYNGTNWFSLSFATAGNICNRLISFDLVCYCASTASNYLGAKDRFFFIFILKRHYTAPTTVFPYFNISIASFTYFMTMLHTHVIYAPLYAHASTTCHIVKSAFMWTSISHADILYKDAYYSTLWTVPILTVMYVS